MQDKQHPCIDALYLIGPLARYRPNNWIDLQGEFGVISPEKIADEAQEMVAEQLAERRTNPYSNVHLQPIASVLDPTLKSAIQRANQLTEGGEIDPEHMLRALVTHNARRLRELFGRLGAINGEEFLTTIEPLLRPSLS